MKKTLAITAIGILLLTGCNRLGLGRGELDTEKIQYGMPQDGEVKYGEHGKETWFAYGALSGTEGVPANGVAQSHLFEDGRYLNTLQLNIAVAKEGTFYEGWLVKGTERVTLGHLSNAFGDARHGLRFEADNDYSQYLNIEVTLEKDDGNTAPAALVAEGKLKPTKRK